MQEKKLLIVGIDPGTTSAYAVIDIDGKLLEIGSSKQLDLNSMIFQSIKLGKALLVGTDKGKVPGLVESFAAKLGAEIISPDHDLEVNEKRQMVKDFDPEDSHQADALASALFAYRQVKPLFDKIDYFAQANNKNHIKNRIKEIVISKKISIKSAVSLIEKKDDDSVIVHKAISERKFTEQDFLRLFNRLKRNESEISLMRKYISKLQRPIGPSKIKEKRFEKNNGDIIDYREKRIRGLENALRSKDSEISSLKFSFNNLNKIIGDISNYYIIKKLDNLGSKEFDLKNKILNIKKNDILLVKNANIFSRDIVDFLRDKALFIITKEKIGKNLQKNLPFVFIDSKLLKVIEERYFAFVDKNELEREKQKSSWHRKIIEEYQKEKELFR